MTISYSRKNRMESFLRVAKEAARNSTYHHKLGAVIVKKGRVISVGYNKPHKTHPKSNTRFKTIHAEFDAILGCDKDDLKGATLYVVRSAKKGPNMAKPCACCMELIEMVGIKKVVYSTSQGFEELHFNSRS
jgi:dCMP deaminase